MNGGLYPPKNGALIFAQAMQTIQMLAIPFMFFGDSILNMLGIPEPSWYKQFAENKMTVFLTVWFLNSIAQNLCSTGAFEIKYNDQMLFSKLEEGRMPTIEEIVHLLSQRGLKASTGEY